MGTLPGPPQTYMPSTRPPYCNCLEPHFCPVLKSHWDVLQVGKGIKRSPAGHQSPGRCWGAVGDRASRVLASVASSCAGGRSMTPWMDLESINLFKAINISPQDTGHVKHYTKKREAVKSHFHIAQSCPSACEACLQSQGETSPGSKVHPESSGYWDRATLFPAGTGTGKCAGTAGWAAPGNKLNMKAL